MRQAAAQALHHCRHRSAFGARLAEQPLMQNVLADLALEAEAATWLGMRLAQALDRSADDEAEALLLRLGTAVGKYWNCKRAPGHAYEAMECIGGSGVMENTLMPRLYREAPVNAIWEGSGNVQCLDVLRAMQKTPATVDAFCELHKARGTEAALDAHVAALASDLRDPADAEYRARDIVERMALALQAACWSSTRRTRSAMHSAARVCAGQPPTWRPARAVWILRCHNRRGLACRRRERRSNARYTVYWQPAAPAASRRRSSFARTASSSNP
jgi:hypothetical protein